MSRAKPKAAKSYLPFIIIGGVLAVVVGLAFVWMNRGDSEAETNAGAPRRQPAIGAPGAQPPHFRGKADAAVVLEEFGDFQCPPCGALHPVLQKIESDYHSRIKFVFRHYPLQQMHKNAFIAARAAEAAGLQNRFWEMHAMLYENQKEWAESPDPRPIFLSYGRRLNLDDRRLDTDIDRPEVGARVNADSIRGRSLGAGGTPTLFINGRLLPSRVYTEDKLREEIEAALAGKYQ